MVSRAVVDRAYRHPLVLLSVAFVCAMCANENQLGSADADAPKPMRRSCSTKADCVIPPPSVCAGSTTLVYYSTYGECINGECQWSEAGRQTCYRCVNGACDLGGTTSGNFTSSGGTYGVPCDSSYAFGGSGGCVATAAAAEAAVEAEAEAEAAEGFCDAFSSAPCPCPDGGIGTRTCSSLGIFGECECKGQCDSEASNCSQDASSACADGNASACTLPPAECIDAHTLRYYLRAHCIDGGCTFDTVTYACACSMGACRNSTADDGPTPRP